ncbi:hypothetical protein APHAL10511_005927 [Amanita phalloides]|nr:hypothetical protein APHAL10511_005927 [Amanita phalloides]
MSCFRPATPGFIVTLAATIILALVSFCVPYLKPIYFLKANVSNSGFSGSITFGTLGYCLQLSNGTTCSKPSVGYELDINGLVGNTLPIQIPQAVVKWLTYALVLHIVALILSAAATVFGLLAHVREMSMTCCGSFWSGFAAAVAFVAFIFDIALFFVAKARISKVGSAQIGNAIWLTLAAWVLLFFSGCFFSVGRCCINRRPRGTDRRYNDDDEERLRLDAVRAEVDRKAVQAKPEGGLPAFHEVQPLAARIDGDAVYLEPYKDANASSTASSRTSRTGYAPAPQGTRAIDEYYTPSVASKSNPRRQNSATTATTTTTSTYPPSVPVASLPQHAYQDGYASASYPTTQQPQQVFSTPPPPAVNHQYYDSSYSDPYDPYSTVPIHHQQPSNNSGYSQYTEPNLARHLQHQGSYHSYNAPQPIHTPSPPLATSRVGPYFSGPTAPVEPQRSYTLSGDGYRSSPVQEPHQQSLTYQSPIPPPIHTNASYVPPLSTSPVKGPRAQTSSSDSHDEPPPGYDDRAPGAWTQ